MPKAPKKPKLSTGKATKPELKPLDTYLAELLNPGHQPRARELSAGTPLPRREGRLRAQPERVRAEAQPDATRSFGQLSRQGRAIGVAGFGERPQETYVHGEVADVDPALARKLGLKAPGGRARCRGRARRPRARRRDGVSATVASLTRLLTEGNPLFKHGKLWTPHRPPRPEKSEGGIRFEIKSDFTPAGDQPQAIAELVDGVRRQERDQVLLGVTGSGKTFTMAKVIEETQRPALDPRAEQDARRAALRRVQVVLPRQRGRILRLLLRLLPARGLCPALRHLHREGDPRSTSRSTACATRRRARSSSATTSSSWPRCPASTASARSRPTRR